VLEKRLQLERELSVVVARRAGGECVTWPVAENIHRDGILDVTIAPARISDALADRARAYGLGVARALDYRGVLCVEMFLTTGGELLVNEIAPRPHNSGHYSIDACLTSQFEQQVRVVCDAPLGSTLQHEPAVMVNLLGDVWFDAAAGSSAAKDDSMAGGAPKEGAPAGGAPKEPDWTPVLSHPRAKLHLYGKREARRGRKMGHVTCLGATLEEAMADAGAIRAALSMPVEPQLARDPPAGRRVPASAA
jgi:5-(carboxyamino)imidazole ribonucleotide synthase